MNKYIKFLFDKKFRFGIQTARGKYNHLSDEEFLHKAYRINVGKKLNLDNPKTYNEKLQWLKLYNRKTEYTAMVDKFEAKKHVADKIGEEYIIPTLGVWDKFDAIDFSILPNQFVLKCTHNSGGLVICRNKNELNLVAARKKIETSLARNYFWQGREWPYKNVKPRIIAEEYISTSENDISNELVKDTSCFELQNKYGLLDYKFMCFDGKVKAFFLDIGVIGDSTGHAENYYRNVYDREGTLLPCKETRENYPQNITLPSCLPKMIEIAEKLSAGIPHIRVDLYCISETNIKVGELTFFHGSGLSNIFVPSEWDYKFGEWINLPQKLFT